MLLKRKWKISLKILLKSINFPLELFGSFSLIIVAMFPIFFFCLFLFLLFVFFFFLFVAFLIFCLL